MGRFHPLYRCFSKLSGCACYQILLIHFAIINSYFLIHRYLPHQTTSTFYLLNYFMGRLYILWRKVAFFPSKLQNRSRRGTARVKALSQLYCERHLSYKVACCLAVANQYSSQVVKLNSWFTKITHPQSHCIFSAKKIIVY